MNPYAAVITVTATLWFAHALTCARCKRHLDKLAEVLQLGRSKP